MLVTIDKILHKNNKSIYWLAKKVDCDYQSLCRLVNNETSKISFSTLENICIALNCTPNDILKIED